MSCDLIATGKRQPDVVKPLTCSGVGTANLTAGTRVQDYRRTGGKCTSI